jgi:hypothetical protein
MNHIPTDHTSTRTGKIARLPQAIRHELNQRLADGEPQQHLVAWLNAHEIVQERLEAFFDGRPITEQNLSDWKQGGFLAWQRHQEARALVRDFLSEAEEISEEIGTEALLDRVSDMVALVLLRFFREVATEESGPTQRRAALEIARELARLRRVDHQRQMLRLRAEQQRRQTPSDDEIRRVRDLEDEQVYDKDLERLRIRAENLRSEYLTGLADGTLTPERKLWIRQFFARRAGDIAEAGGYDLPEKKEEAGAIAGTHRPVRMRNRLAPRPV